MNYQDFGEGLGEALVLVAEGGLLVSVGDQVLGVGIQEPVELLSANGIKGFLFKTLKKEQLQWHKWRKVFLDGTGSQTNLPVNI